MPGDKPHVHNEGSGRRERETDGGTELDGHTRDGGGTDGTETERQRRNRSSTDDVRYLVGLEYNDRAERRRVEYRLENWDGTVNKVPSMTRIVEGDNFYDLYDDFLETVDDPDHLSVYELNDITPSTEERTARIARVYDVEMDKVEWAVESLLNKRTVSQEDATTYQVYPTGGTEDVTLEIDLMEVQRGARMQLTLSGLGPAPNAMKDAFLRDLGYLLPEPEEVFDE